MNGGDAAITPTETKVTVAVLAADLQYIKTKLDQVCNRHEAQDVRIDKLERLAWVLSGTGGLMAAILVPIAVSALKQWLGLV